MLQEFKTFAMKGNVVDLAVAVVIGGAFGKIVSSFVSDIVSPLIGMLGGVDFSDVAFILKKATDSTDAVTLNIGLFLNSIIDFVIIAFAIFIVIKQVNRLKKEEPEAEITEKDCPKCFSKISIKALRCAHCTSEI